MLAGNKIFLYRVWLMRIVLLEDNKRSGFLLSEHLNRAGYTVDLVETIQQFRDIAQVTDHELYMIDLGLPDGDGLDLIRELRASGKKSTPILVTTARSSIPDRVNGLDCGADDYLSKPFHVDEVLARIRALLRRPSALQPKEKQVGQLILNSATGEIFFNGALVEMRQSERRLLALLIRRSGRLVPRNLIQDSLHGLGEPTAPNAIEKLVSRLRKGLDREAMGVELKTIRGAGYVLEESAQVKSANLQPPA